VKGKKQEFRGKSSPRRKGNILGNRSPHEPPGGEKSHTKTYKAPDRGGVARGEESINREALLGEKKNSGNAQNASQEPSMTLNQGKGGGGRRKGRKKDGGDNRPSADKACEGLMKERDLEETKELQD